MYTDFFHFCQFEEILYNQQNKVFILYVTSLKKIILVFEDLFQLPLEFSDVDTWISVIHSESPFVVKRQKQELQRQNSSDIYQKFT